MIGLNGSIRNAIMARVCANPTCRKPLSACFGFVVARDFLADLAGTRPATEVRELCGLCVFRFEDQWEKLEEMLKAA
jgi:hypothetical protein